MNMYRFNSEIQLGKSFKQNFSDTVVKNEPMFFNSDIDFALQNGGPVTKAFLEAFLSERPELKDTVVFDSRVHMLMPGWYPCIPGFHHDDVPRDRAEGQPEYDNPSYRSNHAIGLVNGDICPTQFALGTADFSTPKNDEVCYAVWHKEVTEHLKQGNLKSYSVPSDQVVFFDDRSWHQGTSAVKNGWRWFGRVSWNTARVPTNEIRRQVQVYLENPMQGW
jgi:hypothetical protein